MLCCGTGKDRKDHRLSLTEDGLSCWLMVKVGKSGKSVQDWDEQGLGVSRLRKARIIG